MGGCPADDEGRGDSCSGPTRLLLRRALARRSREACQGCLYGRPYESIVFAVVVEHSDSVLVNAMIGW
eukprot:COSAG02_NODE_2879_length_7828_cov_3.672791_4_plen_68_part_00